MVLMGAVLPLAHLQIKAALVRVPRPVSSVRARENCTLAEVAAQMVTRVVVIAALAPAAKVAAATVRCIVTETLMLPVALTILEAVAAARLVVKYTAAIWHTLALVALALSA